MTAELHSFHFSIKYGVMPRILSGRNAGGTLAGTTYRL